MGTDNKKIACRIECADDKYLTIRLPAEDICRMHMQLTLLKSGKLNKLILQDTNGGSIAVDTAIMGCGLLNNILEMLEQGFVSYGDISWMHVDDEVDADGRLTGVSVGFFY